jgi:hypothetical protein
MAVGIDAFASLADAMPGQGLWARLLRLPIVHGAASFAYKVFARMLYRWNLRRGHW